MAYHRITYGNFTFSVAVMTVSENTMFDSDGMTFIGVEHTFNIKGWITGATPALFNTALQDAKCELHAPRKAFVVEWSLDNSTWSTLWSFDAAGDVDWGPKPGTLDIQQISGGRAAMFGWSVKVIDKQCYDSNCNPYDRPSNVLSVIREWNHAIDPNGFTRRTVSGTLLVTSNSVREGKPADLYRNLVTPGLPLNYKREQQTFDQSANSRVLSFTIVDQEQMWTLPTPISNGNASFTIRASNFGCTINYSLSGRFEAPASVPKRTILDRIASLAATKFPLNWAGTTLIVESRDIVENVYGNSLDFTITAWCANQSGGDVFDMKTGIPFGMKPPGSNGLSQFIGNYGGNGTDSDSGLFAPASPIYDACTPPNGPVGGNPAGSGALSGGQGPRVSTDPGPSASADGNIPTTNTGITPKHGSNPWVAYHEEFSYELDNGLKVFDSKVSGLPPFVQQVRKPTMVCIQAGYAKQIGTNPTSVDPPPQPVLGANGVVIHSTVSAANPEPIGEGTYALFTTRWCYTIRYTLVAPTTTREYNIAFPDDPRVVAVLGGAIENVPDLGPPT